MKGNMMYSPPASPSTHTLNIPHWEPLSIGPVTTAHWPSESAEEDRFMEKSK